LLFIYLIKRHVDTHTFNSGGMVRRGRTLT